MTTEEMRKLEIRLAEKVMGWERVEKPYNSQVGEFWVHPTNGVEIRQSKFSNFVEIWNPTTNPAAAMMVLKRCAEKTYQVSIVECDGEWVVAEGEGFAVEAEGPSLELAICLFAKKLFL